MQQEGGAKMWQVFFLLDEPTPLILLIEENEIPNNCLKRAESLTHQGFSDFGRDCFKSSRPDHENQKHLAKGCQVLFCSSHLTT